MAVTAAHTGAPDRDEMAPVTRRTILVSCPSIRHLSVTVDRDGCSGCVALGRDDLVVVTEPDKPFGYVDVIDEHEGSGLEVLHVAPGGEIGWHRHDLMRERELILTPGLEAGIVHEDRPTGLVVGAGAVLAVGLGVPHRYRDTTDRWQRVLCTDSPPFIPSDEIMLNATVDGRPTSAGRQAGSTASSRRAHYDQRPSVVRVEADVPRASVRHRRPHGDTSRVEPPVRDAD